MLKKVVKYTDFDGNERNDTFYFNLTRAEVIEMEVSTEGGLEKRIQQIVEAKDVNSIIQIFKKIVLLAYGERAPDGKFIKTKELSEAFSHTEAYSSLFMELATNADLAAEFMNGIIPQK